jgi:arylsulfatase B
MEADHPITAQLTPGDNVPGASKAYRAYPGQPVPAVSATLRLDGNNLETKRVVAKDKSIEFITDLTTGSHQLSPVFTSADGHEVGAYYAIITKLP